MRTKYPTSALLLTLLTLAACGSPEADAVPMQAGSAGPIDAGAPMPADHPPIAQLPQDHPDIANGQAPAPGAAAQGETRTGTVLETQNAGGYTYARMTIDGDEIWAAGPQSPIGEGDEVTIGGIMGMTNFYARSLDRTFDQILFVNTFTKN